MSLVFKIKAIYFHKDLSNIEIREQWLEQRNLKVRYGNTAPEKIVAMDGQDYFYYKQISKSKKYDESQSVLVTLEPGILAKGFYKCPKYRFPRPNMSAYMKEKC